MGQKWKVKLNNNNNYYVTYQPRNNHPELSTTDCGLFVSDNNNWLEATPGGIVQDPSERDQPPGLLEV